MDLIWTIQPRCGIEILCLNFHSDLWSVFDFFWDMKGFCLGFENNPGGFYLVEA
jgi:hypothetical protein